MSTEQLQELRARMEANRQPVDRADRYAFPRGWNEALDFVERMIKQIVGKEATS